MKSKEEIQQLAHQVAAYEKEIHINNNQEKIEEIMGSLSFEEMLELDEYMMSHNLL